MTDIDVPGLSALLRSAREERDLKLRDVAEETGISAATLSRIERKQAQPDLKTVRALIAWIDVPLERVLLQGGKPAKRPKGRAQSAPPLHDVEVQFRADPDLAPEAAEALIKIVRTAYAQFVQASGKR